MNAILWAVGAAAMVAAATGTALQIEASAQAQDAPTRAAQAPIVRLRTDASPPGALATRIEPAPVDWSGVRQSLALTQRRDIASAQTVTRVAAPPAGLRAIAPERFKTVAAAEVARPRLPVLAPATSDAVGDLKVYGMRDSYSATADLDGGVAMRISGTRRKLLVGDVRPARQRFAAMSAERRLQSVDAPYLISRSESATDLSFSKFGCGYVLSLMCDDPADPRCAEDDYILSLASSLALLNASAGDGQ
jgi:hypothetical protein